MAKDVISVAPEPYRRLAIILPSFNDARIADAIDSVRRFDDLNTVRLIVVDGGSNPDVVEIIKCNLRLGDHFVSERDHGIFDALNKGLQACDTEFIGWLGADDIFTGHIMASDVVRILERNDLFVAATAIVRGNRIIRLTHSLPSKWRLARFGLHNPHYSTFGRAQLLKSESFRLDNIAADIEYFLRIFDRSPSVSVMPKVCTLQGAGGFSNASRRKTLKVNRAVFKSYASRSNVVFASLAVILKLCYKAYSVVYFKVFPSYATDVMRTKQQDSLI